MKRVIIKFNDTNQFVNLEAEEFHEDGNFIKAYNHSELVAMVDISVVKVAYITEHKEQQ
jgi:hypothetical protein